MWEMYCAGIVMGNKPAKGEKSNGAALTTGNNVMRRDVAASDTNYTATKHILLPRTSPPIYIEIGDVACQLLCWTRHVPKTGDPDWVPETRGYVYKLRAGSTGVAYVPLDTARCMQIHSSCASLGLFGKRDESYRAFLESTTSEFVGLVFIRSYIIQPSMFILTPNVSCVLYGHGCVSSHEHRHACIISGLVRALQYVHTWTDTDVKGRRYVLGPQYVYAGPLLVDDAGNMYFAPFEDELIELEVEDASDLSHADKKRGASRVREEAGMLVKPMPRDDMLALMRRVLFWSGVDTLDTMYIFDDDENVKYEKISTSKGIIPERYTLYLSLYAHVASVKSGIWAAGDYDSICQKCDELLNKDD